MRIINFFALEHRQSLLSDLSSTLRAIVSQRLVGTLDGTRRAAVEVMMNTRHVAELIEQGELAQIKDAIDNSMSPGSQTFEQALMQLIQDGIVSQDEALAHADSASNLFWLINNNGRKQEDDAPPQEEGASFTEVTL